MNNNQPPKNITPLPDPFKPDISLGNMKFEINMDTGAFEIKFSNPTTTQIVSIAEIQNMFPLFAWKLLCEELRRRARDKIIV
jgi:hypothetical protein